MTASFCAIVADDLTGAADTTAPFAKAGLAVRLSLEPEATIEPGVEVLAVSTDSRAVAAEVAAARVGEVTRRLRDHGADQIYKKIDSTLRGNVGVETLAVLDAMDDDAIALVCPAFPPTGRTVFGGRLLVDGVPVDRTSVGRDPVTPVTSSAVAACFPGIDVDHVDVDLVGRGTDAVADALAATRRRVVVADAVTVQDLQALAEAAATVEREVVLVGSAGLAGPAAALRVQEAVGGKAPPPTLVVVGSLHDRAHTQLEALRATATVVQPDLATIEDADVWEQQALEVHARGDREIVLVSPQERGDPARVAARLGEVAVEVASDGVSGVVVTGGDIARAVLAASDGDGLDVIDEVAPGVPLGRIAGGRLAGTAIVTKAGGFGDDLVLRNAVDAIRRLRGATS